MPDLVAFDACFINDEFFVKAFFRHELRVGLRFIPAICYAINPGGVADQESRLHAARGRPKAVGHF